MEIKYQGDKLAVLVSSLNTHPSSRKHINDYVTQYGSTSTDNIIFWLPVRMDKRPMEKAVDFCVNIREPVI